MFKVKDVMTKDVICTESDASISRLIDIMKANNIHRVPVVDHNKKLVGLITEGTISENGGGMATSLSIYELNYLMSKTKVETVMVKNVITVKDYDLVETATERMLTNDIGCLPVVNDDNEVVGIVTQNDVFSTFLTMLGWGNKGTRITVSVKDEIGTVGKLSKIFVDQNINIQSIGVYPQEDGTSDLLIRCDSAVNEELMNALENAGMKVNEVYKNE